MKSLYAALWTVLTIAPMLAAWYVLPRGRKEPRQNQTHDDTSKDNLASQEAAALGVIFLGMSLFLGFAVFHGLSSR